MLSGGTAIGPEHLPEIELLSDVPPDSIPAPEETARHSVTRTLDEVEREHISQVLRAQRGNIKATARVLGISRTTLYKKIREYHIDAPI
jgi:sigma-54 dependent transcriptional regulator, acetoin dehydrogenase operon transcriptional activator AcoR